MYVVWLVGREWDVEGPNSRKALGLATYNDPTWISDYEIVRKFFVSHMKTMYNCLYIYMNMDALKIEGADPAKTVHEARLINNFGRRWGENEFTDWEAFEDEFRAAADPNFGGQAPSTAGSTFVVPIALALTFLFIAQGLN